MSGQDFIVPPRSWDSIAETANVWRHHFGLAAQPMFPIMDLIERVLDQSLGLCRLEVGDRQEMRDAEGYTDPKGKFIILREDVYHAAWAGDGRARFTAAHELGHFVLHTNTPLARALPSQQVKPFQRSEPQANQFAAELLMPANFFARCDGVHSVISRHGVSYEAATHRLNYLTRKGRLN